MSHLNVQVILFYYDRPNMVKPFALESVCASSLKNWEISFIDDSSSQDGAKIIDEFLLERPHYERFRDKIKIYQTEDTIEKKEKRGDAIFGKFANQAMEESTADISLMLCDDDALLPDYTLNLSAYYGAGDPTRIYSYCQLWGFNPSTVNSIAEVEFEDFYLNRRDTCQPSNMLDSSQVTWVRQRAVDDGIRFPWPQTANLDAVIYADMGAAWGPCPWNGFYGQYKGWFPGQLGKRGVRWKVDTEK